MLVFVYAPWCGHCKKFKPIWQKVKQKYQGKVQAFEVNGDKHGELVKKLGVQGFPTVLFIHNGQQVEFEGDRSVAGLEKFFQQAMK